MQSIIFVTGTRADFGKLEPLATAAKNYGFDVGFFITGMHMLKLYGLTKIEVERNTSIKNFSFINQRQGDGQDTIFAKTIQGFSDFVMEHKPDLVVIHGDRVEATACALVCATNYIRCAHIEGGEVSGSIDELYRHCNTKLCNYHFVANDDARQRVLAMGEAENSVFVIGSPELDVHKQQHISLQAVKQYYAIPFAEYGIVIFHPITSEQDTIGTQAKALFDTLKQSNKCFVVIKSNNDPGCEQIFEEIDKLDSNQFKVLPSMRFHFFSTLLRNAQLVAGNSSLGVREAPFLGVASIDIGTRQTQRNNSQSCQHLASSLDTDNLAKLLDENWGKRYKADTTYGSGNATAKFLQQLTQQQFWQAKLQKRFVSK